MTILPTVKPDQEEQQDEAESPPSASTPLSPPNRFGNTSPGASTSSYYPNPRTPPSPPRDREKLFNTGETWEIERRDGGRRRRRVVGTTRTAPTTSRPGPSHRPTTAPRPAPATRPTPATRPAASTPRSPEYGNQEQNNSDDEYDAPYVYDWQKEKKYEKLLKEKNGYIIKRCGEDGACLFRAVADQLYGDQEMHNVVRLKCMDYMVKNRDYFSQFVTEDYMSYVNRKRQDSCFGNQLEMQAMSEMYNRPIEVFIYSLEPVNTLGRHLKTDYPPIRLSYHCNCHYNSIRDPYEPSIGVGLGLPGYKPGLPDQQLLQQGLTASESDDIERIMMQDKMDSSDLDAATDAITAAIARDSYMEWVKANEAKGSSTATTGPSSAGVTSTGASSSCPSSTGASSSCPSSTGDSSAGPAPSASCSTDAMCTGSSSSSAEEGCTSSSRPQEAQSSSSSSSVPPDSTPPHSSNNIPTDSSTLETLYPVYGLEDYDEEKMLEAALALSRAEYVNSMQKNN